MKIIVKRKSSKRRKSTPKKKVNKSRKQPKSMKRKTSKSKSRKSSSRGSNKDMLTRVPVLDKLVRNRTFQDIERGTGRASVVGKLLKLVPNAQVKQFADNPIVRAGLAYSNGGVAGAVYQFATVKGIIDSALGFTNGNGNTQTVNQGGFA